MSMSLKKKVKDLEARVEALEEKDSSANDSEEQMVGFSMAAKKTTANKWDFQKDGKPFDELPIIVKRNRRNLYEYIRTGELPD